MFLRTKYQAYKVVDCHKLIDRPHRITSAVSDDRFYLILKKVSWISKLSGLQHAIQSILTCRMLFELRQYGKRTIRGEGFTEYGSGFTVPVNSLVFRQGAEAVAKTPSEIQHTSDTSLGSSLRDDEELGTRRSLQIAMTPVP